MQNRTQHIFLAVRYLEDLNVYVIQDGDLSGGGGAGGDNSGGGGVVQVVACYCPCGGG